MRTGVLGGTFDPPHLGHLVLGAAARASLALDEVVFVPAGDPYRKADRSITAAETRLEMVEAAIAPLLWARASRMELDRDGPSYSWQTMQELSAGSAPESKWWFILGLDALADIPNWDHPSKLSEVSRLAVASRPPHPAHVPEAVGRAVPGIERRVDYVSMPRLLLSSTDLRGRIGAGQPTEVLLPAGVQAIVERERLYAGG